MRSASSSDSGTEPSGRCRHRTVTDDCAGLIVSWSPITGATTYDVMVRSGGCGNNGWAVAQADVAGTTWTDTAAAAGSTYGYYIVSKKACGTAGDKAGCTALAHSAGSVPTAIGSPSGPST